ncbi:MAG: hypothetical protein ACKVOU_14830 [Cytophagales bacterium]
MAQSIPLETYISLEKEFGKAVAEKVTTLLDFSFAQAERKVDQIATQKKLEIKDELGKELASKADLAVIRSEIEVVRSQITVLESRLERKITIYFLILLSVMILLNKDSLSLIAQILGLVK